METSMSSEPNVTWSWTRRVAYVLTLLGLLMRPAAGWAQGKGHGVEVVAVSPGLLDAQPGDILSLSFRVANKTDREEHFIEALDLPPGWQGIVPTASFPLGPQEAQARIVAFAVARDAPAAQYEVSYSVQSQRDYAIQDTASVAVRVLPVGKLALLEEQKPDYVIAGQEYQARARLLNQGNAELKVGLTLKSEKKYPATIEPAEVTLAPRGSQALVLTVATDASETQRRRHVLQVEAQALGDEEAQISATLTVSVDIIPRVSKPPDLRHRIPAELTLRATGEDGRLGLQAELAGSGTLDEAGTQRAEFLLRGPDTQDMGIFGRRDEYRLSYFTDDVSVRLGDQNYGLSYLTDYARYGRGLGIDVHRSDRTGFGVYYLRNRWEQPRLAELGTYGRCRLNDRVELRLNFLSKERPSLNGLPGFEDRLWSVGSTLRPSDHMQLDLEYGWSDSSRDGGPARVADNAYRIQCDGQLGSSGYYSFTKVHAEPDYQGYYRDADYTNAAVTFPITDRLQGHTGYGTWSQNLGLRGYQPTAPRERLLEFGLNYRLPSNWYVALDYDEFRRRDVLLPADFDYREDALRLSLGRSFGNYSLRAEVRGGTQQDRLAQRSGHVQQYSLFACYQPSQRHAFTFYGGLGDDHAARGSRLLSGSSNLGIAVNWAPTEDTLLDLYYHKYGFIGSQRTSDQLGLRASYTLPNESTWSLEVRRHSFGLEGEDDTWYVLAYAIPLGIPVGMKTTVGGIQGTVFDAQGENQPGIPNAVLTANGAAAVSDQNGHFVFPVLPPGTYSILVDRKSIGLSRVTQSKTPILVEVMGGKMTEIDIGVTDAARVSGTIMVVRDGDDSARDTPAGQGHTVTDGPELYVVGDPAKGEQPETATLEGAVVELADGTEVLRTATNAKGEFVFEGLRPGNWRLKVSETSLPAYHYVEQPEMDLELSPAHETTVSIRAVPRRRRIRIIGAGELELLGPQQRRAPPTPAEGAP